MRWYSSTGIRPSSFGARSVVGPTGPALALADGLDGLVAPAVAGRAAESPATAPLLAPDAAPDALALLLDFSPPHARPTTAAPAASRVRMACRCSIWRTGRVAGGESCVVRRGACGAGRRPVGRPVGRPV